MPKRQLITIDISWDDDWSELSTTAIMNLIISNNRRVKNITISNVNKRNKEKK